MLRKPHTLCLCLLLLFTINPRSRANELYFRQYNNKHGLSHNTVYTSLQDKKGFMWFGTDDGLNRFDGHTFKVYRHNSYQPDNSLPNDHIIRLFEDSDGKIWVCTNRSACYYDEETDSFHPFALSAGNEEFFSLITEDKRKQLWLADYNRVVRYSLANGDMHIYPASNHFHPHCLTLTTEGEPLFSDANDLFRYHSETDKFIKIPVITTEERQKQTTISAICEVPQLGVLVGTDKKGLKLYSYHSRQTETIIPEIQVRAITPYSSNVYWIASESGVYIYNILSREITNLRKSLTNEYAIADNAIYSITKDREGGMWVGSFFGGINYLPREYVSFRRFIGGKTHPQMPGNAIREICADDYGNLWLGTEDNGINRYNLQTGDITNFSLTSPTHPLSATNIHGLLADGDTLWVGTFNKGIEILALPSCRKLKQYTQANTANGLKSDFILCFHYTPKGDFLVGTGNGTVIYDKKTDTFRPWKDIDGLVRQIYSDTKGNIWVVSGNGLFRYIIEKDSTRHYTSDIHKSQTLGSNNITSVFEDSKGRIWVTTVNGFSRYNEATDSFNRITVEDGLPSNIVYRMLEDAEHIFWISTANGLVRFNPETHAMRVFTYTDGLHETQFNYSSSYKAPDGTMYMGTIHGMISFHPQQFREDPYSPLVYLTNIHVPGSKSYFSINSEELTLPHNKSTFTLSYVALSYTSPDAIRYAYMLEGVDTDWNYMGQNKDVTFASLSPGKYVFKVRSTNSSGVWQPNERRLQITVVPPFWSTGWAYGLYALFLVICILLFYNYKKSKLEEKHRLDQAEYERQKEKELYDAKIRFFTFITHEIRTPLTLIKAPLEKILRSADGTPDTKENLRIMEKNTQRLLDLSNQLLDFRKAESKGFRLRFSKTDLTHWFESIIGRFLPAFEKEGKAFHTKIPQTPLWASVDSEALSKIISNLLTNALKYADEQIILELTSSDTKNEPFFSVSVTNDGALIPEDEQERIFTPFYRMKESEHKQGSGIGLSLARSLAELHKGTLTYHQPRGMNQFVLRLPLNVSALNGADSGKPTVLIVEDQADMRQFIVNELSNYYQVLEAENGRVALEILSRHPVKLIVSDVMMPVMDGFELCNEIKNDIHYSHIPFIILTAQHNLQARLTGLNNGADAYMEKPFSIELLLTQMANLLKSRELLNRTYLEKPLTPVLSLAVSPVDELFLKKFNAFIETHLTEDLSVEQIAVEMNMSTSSLYRKVKGVSGVSPNDLIRVIRLKKAVELMRSGEKRINEIAFKTGFSSPAYFSTCFQKQYGKTPTEYLKNPL